MTKEQMSGLQPGDLVTVDFGGRDVTAEIVEDLGPLGVHGARLFHIEIPSDSSDPIRMQVSEEELKEHSPEPQIGTNEIVQFLIDGGLVRMLKYGSALTPPRMWIYRNNAGRVSSSVSARRGEIGGAEVPVISLNHGRVNLAKNAAVARFVRSFGLTVEEAHEVLRRVGTYP